MTIRLKTVLAGLLIFTLASPALATPVLAGDAANSTPPDAVPAGAKAPVSALDLRSATLGFSVSPLTFKVWPTVADIEVKQEKTSLRFTLAADVLFGFDQADLRPEAQSTLQKFLADLQKRAPKARLQVEGHTDGKGSDDYNDRLSQRRAQSVQAWLSNQGLPSGDLVATGFGKRKPVASNTKPDGSDDPEGRQKNRRVEIVAVLR